jgi:iron complex outermembrane receptor protein
MEKTSYIILVNVNGSPGRGAVGTDLNAIPAFAIEKIEVLRDGFRTIWF